MRKGLLVLVACTLAMMAGGQQRYSITHYTNKDGLPSNATKGLEWYATTGLLWIGTEGGVVRWDGSNFNTGIETNARVLGMGVIDQKKQSFYALCSDFSVYIIESGQIRASRPSDKLQLLEPVAASDSAALFGAFKNPQTVRIWPGWIARAGNLPGAYLITFRGGLYLKEGQQTRLLTKFAQPVQFLKANHQVLVATNNGLWWFDPAKKELVRIPVPGEQSGSLQFIQNDGVQMPMVYQGTVLYRIQWNSGSNSCEAVPIFSEMPAGAHPDYVRELSGGGLIVISDRLSGIYMLRRKSVRQLTDYSGKIETNRLVTYGQALLPDGRILSHSGLIYDRKGPVVGSALPVGGSTHLIRFGDYLYFPRLGHVFRYNLTSGTSEQLGQLDESGWTTPVQTQGHLYFISSFGVKQLSGTELHDVFQFQKEKNSGDYPVNNTAIESSPGVLLLGSDNYIRVLDIAQKKLSGIQVSKKAPVRYLWKSQYGIFICTYGEGLFLLQNGRVYALPPDKSDYLRFAHAIVPDGHGFCYITTNNGLFKVSEIALQAAATTWAPVYYHFLGREDGLEQTEFNGGGLPAYLQLPDKTLSFPTISGLAQLQPDSVNIAPPGGVILVQATADGRDITNSQAQFASETKLFQFNVTVPFWGSQENLYGWYRLRGTSADTQWIAFNPVFQRQFDFTSLRPDQYNFEVRTFNGFLPGNFAVRSFHFEVLPPWFSTRPYILLWIAILLLIIWMTISLRTRQLRAQSVQLEATVLHRTQQIEQQKEQLGRQLKLVSDAHDLKERLISVISHNIITPLRYIHRATTMMRDDARSLDPALREKAVDSINDTSLELELLSINLLNWIKLQHKQVHVVPELFTFDDIAGHVKSLLGPVARSKGQIIVVDQSDDILLYQFKDALQVILYNLVLNAITHSGGTTTRLRCEKHADGFTMSVTDNGSGIPEALLHKLSGDIESRGMKETENQGKGFGFIIIRDLVHFIGGNLEIKNEKIGTSISVQFTSKDPRIDDVS